MKLWFRFLAAAGLLVLANMSTAGAAGPKFKAVAFDYFVLFDPNSAVPIAESVIPSKGAEFVRAWRSKQVEYCYLRSMTNDYDDFYKITDNALIYTAQAFHLNLTDEQHERLLTTYLNLKLWPDTIDALEKLKAAGVKVIVISNFSSAMLKANGDHADISRLVDKSLSTDASRTFKPDPRAYQLGVDHLKLQKSEILFAAFGGWDVYGAKRFGYTTYWVNRLGLPGEQLSNRPDYSSNNLKGLLDLVLD